MRGGEPAGRRGDLSFQRADSSSLMLPSSTDTLSSGVRGVEWDQTGLCVICLCFVLFFFLTKETSRLSFSDCRRGGWSAETSELGRNLCRNGIFESKHF